jgi:uncharacterized protein
MKILQKICCVLLMTTFSSVYGGSCWDDKDVDDCRVKAEQGDSKSQLMLGGMYQFGQGVSQDYKEAVKWSRLAAEQGVPEAQRMLGMMYYHGQGVIQDYKESIKWFTKSAEQGDSKSQYNLGEIYQEGKGVPKNKVMAYMFFNLAAVNGNEVNIKSRNKVANNMTSSQLEKSQDMALEWIRSHKQIEESYF